MLKDIEICVKEYKLFDAEALQLIKGDYTVKNERGAIELYHDTNTK